MNIEKSQQLFNQALNVIPGGVNSPVRACKSVNDNPLFINRAQGCLIYDEDDNEYIDYIGSWGPMILGHRHPDVILAIEDVLKNGTSFGAPTALEIEIAQLIIEAVPTVEMVRMVNSGTEATMSAIRLARGITKRNKIIKFDGCYHGHADTLLVEAGSGVATLAIPGSPGVPNSFVKETISLPYNDVESVKKIIQNQGNEIACIIVEPIAGNMGLIKPEENFLQSLREITKDNGSLLIFDEVMTGFRVSFGGAQQLYNIDPDITCFGKIIGGGMPVGAYGGKKEFMNNIAPSGSVYQAGTLSGNPLAMAAGISTLKKLKDSSFYRRLNEKSDYLVNGIRQVINKTKIKAQVDNIGSMVGLFFTDEKVKNFSDAKKCNLDHFSMFYSQMRNNGIYIAPSQFEVLFVSDAHDIKHLDQTINAVEKAFNNISNI